MGRQVLPLLSLVLIAGAYRDEDVGLRAEHTGCRYVSCVNVMRLIHQIEVTMF